MKVKSFRDLQVWQKAMQLTKSIYEISAQFPRQEEYVLTSQMRRSIISVVSNIAEGSAKHSTKEFIRFIAIAYGSLSELEAQIEVSLMLGYTPQPAANNCLEQSAEIGRMLNGLTRSLSEKLNSDHRTLETANA